MPLDNWLAFVGASTLILLIPGPTIITVMSYSLSHGRRARLPLALAVTAGDATALAMSLAGLGAILAASAFWFTVVKIVGGIYLLYLGIRMLLSGITDIPAETMNPPTSRLILNTYLVTALNPKGIVFFIAFLPQFIAPETAAGPQLWTLAATFVSLAAINTLLYARFASEVRDLLDSAATRQRFNALGGLMLAAAGIWALLVRRPLPNG